MNPSHCDEIEELERIDRALHQYNRAFIAHPDPRDPDHPDPADYGLKEEDIK